MKTVLIQGSFDILHVGHARVFEFAKAQGDFLIVALNTDSLLKSYKNRDAVMPWADKKELIKAFRAVDLVVEAPDYSPMDLLRRHGVDVYIIADEHEHTKKKEIAYMEAKGGSVVIAPRFSKYGTRDIKGRLLMEHLKECGSEKIEVTLQDIRCGSTLIPANAASDFVRRLNDQITE